MKYEVLKIEPTTQTGPSLQEALRSAMRDKTDLGRNRRYGRFRAGFSDAMRFRLSEVGRWLASEKRLSGKSRG